MQRQQRALLLFGFDKGDISGDEECVLNLGRVGVPGSGQELDGDSLPQLSEALDPLQGGGGTTVLQHSTQDRDVLLYRGHGVVAVQDVAAVLSLYSQVIPIVFDSSVTPLLDVDVGRTDGNSDNVIVSIPGLEKKPAGFVSMHLQQWSYYYINAAKEVIK